MEMFDKTVSYILSLDRKHFQQYLLVSLAGFGLLCGGIIYWSHSTRNKKIDLLNQIHEQAHKNDKVLRASQKIKAEETRIQQLLEDNKEFNIKSYFEQFCQQHRITPESGWDTETLSIDGNDTFDEILLPATFKQQTTQVLVTLLNSIDKNEIVYIKELEVKRDKQKTITFTLTIATKKRKLFWED